MRVLVIPSWYPVYGNFFLDQSVALARKGIEVDILVNDLTSLKDFTVTRFIRNLSINVSNYNNVRIIKSIYWKIPRSEKLNIRLWSRKTLRLFRKYLSRYGRPDLIHLHSSMWAGYAASLIYKKYCIPYIITEHRSRFVYNNIYARRLIKKYYIKYIRRALEKSGFIITVSKSMINTLVEINPSVRDRIETIPNMTDTGFFVGKPGKKQTKPFIFLSIGLFEEAKGMDILLKAFAQFSVKYKDSLLKIAGDGSQRAGLYSLRDKLGIKDKVIFLGKISQDKLLSEYQEANAFVLASRFEAFGVVFIEALSAGLPVIGTRSGGPEEIINEANGILADTNDVDELVDAMERLYKNYNKYDPGIIRQYIIDNYSEDIIAGRIIEKYNYVMKSSGQV